MHRILRLAFCMCDCMNRLGSCVLFYPFGFPRYFPYLFSTLTHSVCIRYADTGINGSTMVLHRSQVWIYPSVNLILVQLCHLFRFSLYLPRLVRCKSWPGYPFSSFLLCHTRIKPINFHVSPHLSLEEPRLSILSPRRTLEVPEVLVRLWAHDLEEGVVVEDALFLINLEIYSLMFAEEHSLLAV